MRGVAYLTSQKDRVELCYIRQVVLGLWMLNKKYVLYVQKYSGQIYSAQWPSFKTTIHWLLYKIESLLFRDKAMLLRSPYANGYDGGQSKNVNKWENELIFVT